MATPKILTLDIETTPLRSYHWGLFDQNIGLDMIETEWSILSFAAKWLGKREVIYADTSGRGVKNVRNDKKVAGQLWKLLDKADIIVAQNGVSFDIKKINARLIMLGYGPYSPVRVIDTLRAARANFKFTSNKLEWQSRYLTNAPKSKHKKFPGIELWLECMKDNAAAWAELKRYNIQDVRATEKLYLRQRPWITNHPNMSTYDLTGNVTCPKCDGARLQMQGIRVLQAGVYQRFQCQDCGGWARGKILMNSKDVRKVKLS
jgi:DNA polymerase elongation subunit (family B)